MALYAYLSCHDCRQHIWLGKALRDDADRVFAFHRGGADQPAHWKRDVLNQVVWKFLADHTNHRIDVRLETQMTDEMHEYQEIGGDTTDDVSFEDYVKGWLGIVTGDDRK